MQDNPFKKRQPGSAGNVGVTLEQELTKRLSELPIPIRIARHAPESGSSWYQWHAMFSGSGDCGTFEDAVIEALTYLQRSSNAERASRPLIATPGRYTSETVVTLQSALRKLQQANRRVRATEAMYLLVGSQAGQEWLTGEQALGIVLSQHLSGSIYADWASYIESEQGPDPAGIYLFLNQHAYRAFDIEPEPAPLASSTLITLVRRLWTVVKRDYAPDADDIQRRHASTIAILFHADEINEAALHQLVVECLEILEDNPRGEEFFA